MTTPRLIAGCMTGTSLDALDIALVECAGRALELRARLVSCSSTPLGALGPRLRAVAEQAPHTAGQLAQLALDFGAFHARSLVALLRNVRPDLICVHGQTVFHAPPVSWQLINPAAIAREVGAPVVYDLRQADLAAGGQGAPITPIADWVLFRAALARSVVNLGGFCNVTHLPEMSAPAPLESIHGADVCACNHLLDGVARRVLNEPFDRDGAAAARGKTDPLSAGALAARLSAQAASGRSLGTRDELDAWAAEAQRTLAPDDAAATAVDAVARTIAAAIPPGREVVLAGGGTRNLALVRGIERNLGRPALMSDALGVPVEHRESVAMAVLGALCQDRVSITIPAVTGRTVPAAIAGAWLHP